VAPLNRILPGAWDRFISWMTASRESGGPIIRVGESGEGIPLDAYLKLQDVELKRTAVDVFAKSLSDLVQAGLNAARSVDQGAPHPQQHVSDNLPPPPPLNLDCAGCSAPLEVLPGVREFQCPACSTAQTLSGRIMGPAPQPPAQEGAAAPPPTPSRPSYVPYWERQGTSAEPSPPPVVGEGPEKEDEAEG
ncbi:MAG TPA: hypothetical protein VFA32_06200, partial [Dehalococcoidia bacterium]|nr:hypothetical protein [Dehalococcoidia bacterium]